MLSEGSSHQEPIPQYFPSQGQVHFNSIYRCSRKNNRCHHSLHVDLNYLRNLLSLFLVSRTDPCNLLLPITRYVPSSLLLMALTDTIRRPVLLTPSAHSFTFLSLFLLYSFANSSSWSDVIIASCTPLYYVFNPWCFQGHTDTKRSPCFLH